MWCTIRSPYKYIKGNPECAVCKCHKEQAWRREERIFGHLLSYNPGNTRRACCFTCHYSMQSQS